MDFHMSYMDEVWNPTAGFYKITFFLKALWRNKTLILLCETRDQAHCIILQTFCNIFGHASVEIN